tara:strand:- start:1082 stop:1513 length:432 start_codon:yes stop_codon:yes gene_type:complete
MADDNTKWCQNPRCPEKKNSNQIRGTKGKKFFQSNAVNYGYGGKNFCTLRCYDQWADTYMDRAIDTLGIRIVEPVKLPMESSWNKGYDYHWNNTDNARNDEHFLENKLMNIKIPITEHQYNSIGWSNSDCMALANTLRPKQSA